MPVISVQQFKDILEELNYAPRHARNTADSQSAELFNRSGEKINNVKLKFLIQEDGGTWGDGLLIKPEFIWDFKKLIAGYIVDNGNFVNRFDVFVNNAKDTNDGIYFTGNKSSYARNTTVFSTTGLNNNYVFFNGWFTPEYTSEPGILMNITDGEFTSYFNVNIAPIDVNTYSVFVYSKTESGHSDVTIYGPFTYGFKQNLQIYIDGINNLIKGYINGSLRFTETIDSDFYIPVSIYTTFGEFYKGEISYITINFSNVAISDTIIANFCKFQYPLPRKKEYVDLSQEFETNARNLLIDAKTVDKAIESLKGQLYIKTNNITLRD